MHWKLQSDQFIGRSVRLRYNSETIKRSGRISELRLLAWRQSVQDEIWRSIPPLLVLQRCRSILYNIIDRHIPVIFSH